MKTEYLLLTKSKERETLLKKEKISIDILDQYSHTFTEKEWSIISQYQELNEEFIRKWSYEVDWNLVSEHQILSKKIIFDYNDQINWLHLLESENYKDFEIIETAMDNINWLKSSSTGSLSDNFIMKYGYELYWFELLNSQLVSEDCINFYIDELNEFSWEVLSKYQDISCKFIMKNMDKINFDLLKENKVIDQELLERENIYEAVNIAKKLLNNGDFVY
jgi:hypothetical protein